jgi:RNA polymerase sigma factor (sigma-70 family)
MLESLDNYRPRAGAGFMSWVFRIARNRSIDSLRSSRPHLPLEGAEALEASTGDTTSLAAAGCMEAESLRLALSKLPKEDRELLELRYFFGFSHRQAAEVLNVKPVIIKSRLNAALARLRRQYKRTEKWNENAT